MRKPDKNCAFLLDFLRSIWNVYAARSGLPRYMQHPDKFDALNALDEIYAPLARLAVCEARPPHRPSLVILYAPPLRTARPGVTALIPLPLYPRPLSLFYGRNETQFSFGL